MVKSWLTLGFFFTLVAVGIYLDQLWRMGFSWKWEDFFHHECWIGMAGCVAMILFIVAIVERIKGIG